MIKTFINFIKEVFCAHDREGLVFNIIFWFVVILGGGCTINAIGRYLQFTNSPYYNLFAIGAFTIVMTALLIDPLMQSIRDIKRDGGFFTKKNN